MDWGGHVNPPLLPNVVPETDENTRDGHVWSSTRQFAKIQTIRRIFAASVGLGKAAMCYQLQGGYAPDPRYRLANALAVCVCVCVCVCVHPTFLTLRLPCGSLVDFPTLVE